MNKKFTLIFSLVTLIIILIASLFLINQQSQKSTYNISNLKGYLSFRNNLDSLDLAKDNYARDAYTFLQTVEDSRSSPEEKYNALKNIASLLSGSYSMTNNNVVFQFYKNSLVVFVKNNFSQYYKSYDFIINCQDPKCANSPESKEIVSIIDEINTHSEISEGRRSGAIQNLKNNMFYNYKNSEDLVSGYITTASMIRKDDAFKSAGVNIKIADEIDTYLKQNYPKEFNKMSLILEL